ncbi:carbamoyl phosphate synthetase small subunit, glutamine amidotransferase [uncultured Desulfobacterium sp.]|uniref:Carbamoyl phosphate synthase small chain n=1 Tax=uncultured Desulfobacterium sp. TaxID=201089 RepID=A0A445MT70_9BACT|nr:carbamoyl phosphate synthetase small subunit, glutamine amidotransferase [uncultured Desulfobacterium sp.]
MKALLALEDGTIYEGRSFTGPCFAVGEVVFNTSMSGYQEILTDPSYCGQMVTMTYPLIGNYGINEEDIESERIQVRALLVREYQEFPSNWRSQKSLAHYLKENGIPGIEGVDTRAITRHIRLKGAMKAALSTEDTMESLLEKARMAPDMEGCDLVKEVTCKNPVLWRDGIPVRMNEGLDQFKWPERPGMFRVVAMDFGVKYNILRSLEKRGCTIVLVPADTDSASIDLLNPDGLFLSNGPGDPAAVTYAVETIRNQIGKRPIFGICLGHQLIGLALGGKTFKLKFGHRGGNQPVKDLMTGKVEITSQNHGFCVDMESLRETAVELSHINLNDNTLEGLEHTKLPLFSVQYHPEASPGPHDASYLFDRFIEMMRKHHPPADS